MGFFQYPGNLFTSNGFFPDGSVTAPAISFSNDTNTGFYRVSSDTIGMAVGGIQHSQYLISGGPNIQFNTTSAQGTFMRNAVSDGSFSISADTGSGGGRNFLFYGGSHATLANVLQIRRATTVEFSIDGAGLVTIGPPSGTQRHRINAGAATAGAVALTLSNGPTGTSGSPNFWIQLNFNGTNVVMPAWSGA